MESIIIRIAILAAVLVSFMFCASFAYGEETDMISRLPKDRQDTIATIKKVSNYPELNIYSMEVKYDYSIDNLTPMKIDSTQEIMETVFNEAAQGIKFDYTAPDYGCSAFTLNCADGKTRMGRNYDFKFDSSAMIVYCHPENGYASVAHAALDNVNANVIEEGTISQVAALTAPFICLDGMNEKGVGIAVLTLDTEPVCQDTGKPKLATTILIRLVLDRAASTQEAVELLKNYDMYAISGRDYHFYITDSTGDGRIIEFDCESGARETVVTSTRSVTNFFICHMDKVLPNQKNGIYGHGRERYDKMEAVFEANVGTESNETAWEALKAASQLPNPENVTSNTQWSIVYNLTDLTYEFILHRAWDDVFTFGINP